MRMTDPLRSGFSEPMVCVPTIGRYRLLCYDARRTSYRRDCSLKHDRHRSLKWLALVCLIGLAGCAPEVGSERWCKAMEEKPKGDWSANEAVDYTKHCAFD